MEKIKPKNKCSYYEFCYLAEAADCFGYKSDCPLYKVSNQTNVSENDFHKAMDTIINTTKMKYYKSQK